MTTKQAIQKTEALVQLLKAQAQGHESSKTKAGARKAQALRVNAQALEKVLVDLREAQYEASKPRWGQGSTEPGFEGWDHMDV